MQKILAVLMVTVLTVLSACNKSKHIGSIDRLDPLLDSIISPGRELEIIAEGFKWTEGPLWLDDKKKLLFSDVFENKVFEWSEEKGTAVFLSNSGYNGSVTRGGELGSNGLMLNKEGKLVLCQHGNRQIAIMKAGLEHPSADFTTLASSYEGKKLNSPNDGAFSSTGNLFFTDPPYGLEGRMADPAKEIKFQGVYRVNTSGQIKLLCDTLSRPNGIAFFPGEKKLLVANSDSTRPYWYSFDLINDSIINGKIFYNASSAISEGKGLPDGLKIDRNGNVFAAGPAGVFIFNSNGKLLGKIKLPVAPANCALTADQKTLFITATNYVLRLKMR